MTTVKWSAQASQHLRTIFESIAISNEAAAIQQIELILGAVAQLAAFPLSGPMFLPDRTGRQITVTGTRYIVLYRYAMMQMKLQPFATERNVP